MSTSTSTATRTPGQLAALVGALVGATYDSGDDRAFYPEQWEKIDTRIETLTDRLHDAIGDDRIYFLYDWDSNGATVQCNGCEHTIRFPASAYGAARGKYAALLFILNTDSCGECERRADHIGCCYHEDEDTAIELDEDAIGAYALAS